MVLYCLKHFYSKQLEPQSSGISMMWSLLEFRIVGSTSDLFNENLQLGPPVSPMILGSEEYRSVRCQQRPSHPDTCWYLRRLHPLFSNTLYSMPVSPAHLSPPLPSLRTHGTHGAFYPGYPPLLAASCKALLSWRSDLNPPGFLTCSLLVAPSLPHPAQCLRVCSTAQGAGICLCHLGGCLSPSGLSW